MESKLDINELYKELGIVSYNLEFQKAVLEQLEQEKDKLLIKIQEIQNESIEEEKE
jgi:hypothetical protein